MSLTITSLESGFRIKLAESQTITFTQCAATLHEVGFSRDGSVDHIRPEGLQQMVPGGSAFIVHKADAMTGQLAGWFVWRSGTVYAGYATNLPLRWFDRYGRNFVGRVPGEPKPGDGKPSQPKALTAYQTSQIGQPCPVCGTGTLRSKTGQYGEFVSCDRYPHCRHIVPKTAPEPTSEPTPVAAPAPTTTEPTMTAPAPISTDKANDLLSIIRDIAGGALDEAAVRRIAAEEASKVAAGAEPRVLHVKVNGQQAGTVTGRAHALLPELVANASMKRHDGHRFAMMLVGDAGTGKSTLCKQAAAALGLRYGYLNCSGGVSESRLVGRMTPNLSTGEECYTPSVLIDFFENGGLYCLDEVDGADENALLALNGLMEADEWTAPDGRKIARSAEFILTATGNTYGTGANRTYNGRNQLDGAFLDRWITMTVDYDTDLEKSLCATKGLAERVQSARSELRKKGMRRWLTTRTIVKADAMVQQLGLTMTEALIRATEGWTNEDRTAVGLI